MDEPKNWRAISEGIRAGATESAGLAAVKAREAAVRDAIGCGEATVEIGPFNMGQLGLCPIYGDRHGRLWRNEGGMLTLVRGGGAAIE